MNAREYLSQFAKHLIDGNKVEAKKAHSAYTQLRSQELMKESKAEKTDK